MIFLAMVLCILTYFNVYVVQKYDPKQNFIMETLKKQRRIFQKISKILNSNSDFKDDDSKLKTIKFLLSKPVQTSVTTK